MKKTLSLFALVLIFSCGGKGVEGFVGQIISITAEENFDETDIDYTWIIINQPDGSLIGSKDLKYNYLDLLPAFDGQNQKKIWNDYDDPHPSAFAHKLMANRMFNHLTK